MAWLVCFTGSYCDIEACGKPQTANKTNGESRVHLMSAKPSQEQCGYTEGVFLEALHKNYNPFFNCNEESATRRTVSPR